VARVAAPEPEPERLVQLVEGGVDDDREDEADDPDANGTACGVRPEARDPPGEYDADEQREVEDLRRTVPDDVPAQLQPVGDRGDDQKRGQGRRLEPVRGITPRERRRRERRHADCDGRDDVEDAVVRVDVERADGEVGEPDVEDVGEALRDDEDDGGGDAGADDTARSVVRHGLDSPYAALP